MATRPQVRTFLAAQPLRPFTVTLADGRSFSVAHPELVACSPDEREMVLYDDHGEMDLLEMLLIGEMKRVSQRKSTDGNGT